MFKLISFQANGERVKHAGERPAFYGLVWNGTLVEHFTSVAALRLAVERIQLCIAEERAKERTEVSRLAA